MRYEFATFLLIALVAEKHGSSSSADTSKENDQKLQKLLSGDRTAWQSLPIQYTPIVAIPEDTWPNTQVTKCQIYDSKHKYPPKNAFNYLIDTANTEVVINENNAVATEQFVTGFAKELSHAIDVSDRFYELLKEMGRKKNVTREDFDTDEIDINGFGSDYYYANPKKGDRGSTGMNGEYFLRQSTCANLKNCNVYQHFRVVHKSISNIPKSYSCQDIMRQFLPQIYDCIDKYGVKQCPLLLTHGYFRDVWKVKVPDSKDQFVILKMMRPKKYDDCARDLQRNIRESILLYYLQKEEEEFIGKYGSQFKSDSEKRAFPYVRELGHCTFPTYMSVTPYYNLTMEKFIKSGLAAQSSIKTLIKMAIDIAKGTEVLHNMRGGPYHHTDIAIDQYMMDGNGRVLLGDFNRGKFQFYRFREDFKDGQVSDGNDGVIKCEYCAYESDGRNRAPEELKSELLDSSIDVYSTAMTIWSLFSGTRVWTKPWSENKKSEDSGIGSSSSGESFSYKEIRHLVHETWRRPIMPYNMPYALKELVRWAIAQNPKKRPSAKQFRQGIEDIYQNLDKYTRNRGDMVSAEARKKKMFKDHVYPHVPHNFPACCKHK